MPIRARLRRSWRGDIIYIMKNLLYVFIISIISFFLVNDSKASIPDVILKCEPNWNPTDRPFNIRHTKFYKLNKDSELAMYYTFFASDEIVKVYEYIMIVHETDDLKKLEFTGAFEWKSFTSIIATIDRETLIRDYYENTDQCYILTPTKTIEEYLEEHKILYQSVLDNKIEDQLRKNKI